MKSFPNLIFLYHVLLIISHLLVLANCTHPPTDFGQYPHTNLKTQFSLQSSSTKIRTDLNINREDNHETDKGEHTKILTHNKKFFNTPTYLMKHFLEKSNDSHTSSSSLQEINNSQNQNENLGNKKLVSNYFNTGVQVASSSCKINDNETQQACFEYCTKSEFETGSCSNDQKVCVCQNSKNGDTKTVKLFKPAVVGATKVGKRKVKIPHRETKLVPSVKGDFECDNSAEGKSICQVYCTTKGSSHAACSLDQKSCLCFKIQSTRKLISRVSRDTTFGTSSEEEQRIGRDFLAPELEEHVIGLGLVKQQKQIPYFPFWSPPIQNPVQPSHLAACTPFSCVNNCPPGCDNLCTQNLQCFCSCPQDEFHYDYFEGSPFPQFSFYG